MEKIFEKPTIEVVTLANNDVIATSQFGETDGNFEKDNDLLG